MTERVPLALFTYNRPRHTQRALQALSAAPRLSDVRLIIFSDAPKNQGHVDQVAATREVIRSWLRDNGGELVERPTNLGLARSIAGSVDELTRVFGRVIVLEDDLVAAPDLLGFMLDGLEEYANESRVAQISGCLLAADAMPKDDGLFLPLTTTWGWATWRRAWDLFRWEKDIDASELDRDNAFRRRFTVDGSADYVSMLRDRLEGKNDSWGILWWFAVARANALVLYPRQNLIWNGGFDNSGVHCAGTEQFEPEAPADFRKARLSFPLKFPKNIAADTATMAAVESYLRYGPAAASSADLSSLLKRANRSVRRLLGRNSSVS